MRCAFSTIALTWAVCGAAIGLAADTTLAADPAETAREIEQLSGVHGGFVLHLGCGDGQLTVALRRNDRFTVVGFDADEKTVDTARRYVQRTSVYGPVSIERFGGDKLPFVDNLINLVVAGNETAIDEREIMRVLAPRGVFCRKTGGKWKTKIKQPPSGMDQWTHFLHDAGNNAVADDSLVGPPRSMQWVAPPLWLRSHETPSGIQAPVSANGRLFYFLDEGLIGITDERIPDRWSLVCRDAFNGKLLWKRALVGWGWRAWSRDRYEGKDWTTLRAARTNVPNENQRRMVAMGERVFATLEYGGPLVILDAATGAQRASFPQTVNAREILVADGTAVVYAADSSDDGGRRRGEEVKPEAKIVAIDVGSEKVLWVREVRPIRPLLFALDSGRVTLHTGTDLLAIDLKFGRPLWQVKTKMQGVRTLVAADQMIVMHNNKAVAVHSAKDGRLVWTHPARAPGGSESEDLFVIDGLVYRGMLGVDAQHKPASKSANAMVTGWDLKTGEVRQELVVENLRSPEHHHRCYRNKATTRFLISSLEGAEFVDLQGSQHSQENWIRGSCRSGMMPCNGMLYVPPDQCFCEPGAKLLGYAALSAATERGLPLALPKRLEPGPAYRATSTDRPDHSESTESSDQWPTYRHDAARHGSSTTNVVAEPDVRWTTPFDGRITAPVSAGGVVLVAQIDAHTVHALDANDGRSKWQFTANGRIDSPPTIYEGQVLFGSHDGWVYCLRLSDGQLAWRFQAAPFDRRIGSFDQIESAWPVPGSVLVHRGIAYVAAGRSTYLDGGVRLYGLDPRTGSVVHEGRLQGPFPKRDEQRDVGFYVLGANADVLVAEGDFIYMRQKKLTLDLEEVKVEVLSSKGAQDTGLHVFSTAGLLDDSWYNRTFWMYSSRWPGFQLANQAPKTGQLLVVDAEQTYAVRAYYQRNVHSPMFFPGTRGYLLFADANTTEPQIVGEPGAKTPVRWLPQSDYSRARGNSVMRTLESEAFGLDKMIGYTRAEPPAWMTWLPVRIRAMVKTQEKLFVAGPPDELDPEDPYASFEGRRGARLVAVSSQQGKQLSVCELPSPPIFDGMIAAGGKLFVSLENGQLVCLGHQP